MIGNLQTAIQALQKLSTEEQETAAQAIMDYATHDGSASLSDEQAAEITRRVKSKNRKFVSIKKARTRLRHLGV